MELTAVHEPVAGTHLVEKPETARRVLQRVRAIFDYSIVNGWRESDPCRGVVQSLGGTGHRDIEHHRSMPYAEVPAFIRQLRTCNSKPITKLAFEWLILTATRSGETRGATWDEIDGDRWVIPRERMKGPLAHIVPLPYRCLEILRAIGGADRSETPTGLLFRGLRGKPLSQMTFTKVLRDLGLADRATAHGFRSSFRNWAAETNQCRGEVAEAALSHAVADKTDAAYRRTSYLEERVGLMQRWADHCCPR